MSGLTHVLIALIGIPSWLLYTLLMREVLDVLIRKRYDHDSLKYGLLFFPLWTFFMIFPVAVILLTF